MRLVHYLTRLLFGATPKMRRVMAYWASTALVYGFCLVILAREQAAGVVPPIQGDLATALGVASLLIFYILLRCAPRFNIPNWKLALKQAQFAIVFDLVLYAVLDSLRGAMLIGLPVVIVFCAFSLRPRQTVVLSACAIAGLAATMTALVLANPARHPLYTESVYFALTTFGMVSVTAITGELHRLRAQLVKAVETIRTLATTDELTLLANRRHMHELLAVEQQRRAACPNHVCVALIDIDFFKAINDKYGHAVGDAVLKSFAGEASATLRAADTLARWGGEEFLLLMPDTRLDEALAVIERMVARIAAMRVSEIDPELRITFSAGVAASLPLERFDQAIHRADEAMYRAKAKGRNCVLAA
ncbi:MAG: GGDEF domain-containing protein [Pseudomonadota bacterium]